MASLGTVLAECYDAIVEEIMQFLLVAHSVSVERLRSIKRRSFELLQGSELFS